MANIIKKGLEVGNDFFEFNVIPTGGTAGQVLTKNTDANYDLKWANGGSGGTTDYNSLENKPIINQDLDAAGFTPVVGAYYKHNPTTIFTPTAFNTTDNYTKIYFDFSKTLDETAFTEEESTLIINVDDGYEFCIVYYSATSHKLYCMGNALYDFTTNKWYSSLYVTETGCLDFDALVPGSSYFFKFVSAPENWNGSIISATPFATQYIQNGIYFCLDLAPTYTYLLNNKDIKITGSFSLNRLPGSTVGENSVSIGTLCTASGDSSHAEGTFTVASGDSSHAEGYYTIASGEYSHTENYKTTAYGKYSHAEGYNAVALGDYSHAEGYTYFNNTLNVSSIETNVLTLTNFYTTYEYYIFPGAYLRHEENNEYKYYKISAVDISNKTITLATIPDIIDTRDWNYFTAAYGQYSHAEGYQTIASATTSHAEGSQTKASGNYSHTEGNNTVASDSCCHAEGHSTVASGLYSHAEGANTTASSGMSHAEGEGTTASGNYSHAEGYKTIASGRYSHAEGKNTIANHWAQHVFGEYNIEDPSPAVPHARGNYIEIVGKGTADDTRSNARTLDWNGNEYLAGNLRAAGLTDGTTTKTMTQILAGGGSSITVSSTGVSDGTNIYNAADKMDKANPTGTGSFSLNRKASTTVGNYSVAEGYNTTASGNFSHAEGSTTTASGNYSHAEGWWATASGNYSHAECAYTIASGDNSHAEGYYTTASGSYSHTEGLSTFNAKTVRGITDNVLTLDSGHGIVVENILRHTENGIYKYYKVSAITGTTVTLSSTPAISDTANWYLVRGIAYGDASHTEGQFTTASGSGSHAEGYYTVANHKSQHVFGEYNEADTSTAAIWERGNYVEIVGNGTSSRSNARTLDWSGNEWLAGKLEATNGVNYKQADGTSFTNGLKFVKCTQAQYDALVTAGTVDSNTFYIIVG